MIFDYDQYYYFLFNCLLQSALEPLKANSSFFFYCIFDQFDLPFKIIRRGSPIVKTIPIDRIVKPKGENGSTPPAGPTVEIAILNGI